MKPLLRALTTAEVRTLLEWARSEGWNPGPDDAEAFHAADRQGFIGAFLDDEMVAGISAVAYGAEYGFIGLFICRPEHRGRGYGRAVWDAGMAHLSGRVVALDGVAAQQLWYRAMGFAPLYETIRRSGTHRPQSPPDAALVSVTAEIVPQIMEFDRRFFPARRDRFLAAWLGQPRTALALVRDDTLHGYGVLRPCHEGFKIGPLFARTGADALALFEGLARLADGAVLHIDVPDMAQSVHAFLDGIGFERGFTTARMVRGKPLPVDMGGVFGITTLELG